MGTNLHKTNDTSKKGTSRGACNCAVSPPEKSSVHNIETLRQFCTSESPTKTTSKKDFVKVNQRWRNIQFAKMLERSSYSDNTFIQKNAKNLLCCQSMAMVGQNADGYEIMEQSKRCRNKLCPSCSKVRANRMRHRFWDYLESSEGKEWSKDKKSYMITLTLKHDESTRKGVYLKELKGYITRLIRSKFWKDNFKNAGWFTNYEMTYGKNGLHIHSHILIMADTVANKAKTIQNDLSKKWLKLTKDSSIVRFDLCGKKRNGSKSAVAEAMEIFKYTVKGNSNTKVQYECDYLAEWLIATKGANMITASGHFRGLGITSAVSQGETSHEQKEPKEYDHVFVGKTKDIRFEKSAKCSYSTRKVKDYSKEPISDVSKLKEVTGYEFECRDLFRCGFSDSDIDRHLDRWLMARSAPDDDFEPLTFEEIERDRQIVLFSWEKENHFLTENY